MMHSRHWTLLWLWVAFAALHADEPRPPEHWAFAPITRPAVPAVRNRSWPRNPIDRFILARLEREHLAPAPPANAGTLLRRVRFGTTGLPPTPGEVEAFTGNRDEARRARMIEGWLSSTQHGEHWARHWMDVARYADSAGYELDYLFTHAWRYRDWLVRAFAGNKPMDRFVREQIAGDELWPDSGEASDGALFLSIGPMRFEGGIQRAKERENEWLTDLADTTGLAFLGMTTGCARCHDHKYDPITQADYYGLQAIFADSALDERRVGQGGGPGDTRPAFIRAVLRDKPGTVRVLRRGEVDAPSSEAVAGFPAFLPGGGPAAATAHRRAGLAAWLTSRDNPLVARVLANRAWQWLFGQGLVRTPNDFGRQGEAPTHPELLDWLASELVDSGWDLRHIERLILDSATYRQSSLASSKSLSVDPTHRWLSGFPRRRLQAEELRDAMLSVSGLLESKSFGPPVVPPVESWALAALRNQNWEPAKDPREWHRRSIYRVVRRSIKLPFFDAFNGPDTIGSCAARDSTVVASQALALLNGEESLENARALAGRLWTNAHGDPSVAAARAWTWVYGRPATDGERRRALAFLKSREAAWNRRAPGPDAMPTGIEGGPPMPPARGAAWVEWCLALFNSNEFVHVD